MILKHKTSIGDKELELLSFGELKNFNLLDDCLVVCEDDEYGYRYIESDLKIIKVHLISYDVYQCNELDTCPYCQQGDKVYKALVL